MAMHRHKHRHRHKQMQIQGSWASAYTIGVSYIVLASSPGLVVFGPSGGELDSRRHESNEVERASPRRLLSVDGARQPSCAYPRFRVEDPGQRGLLSQSPLHSPGFGRPTPSRKSRLRQLQGRLGPGAGFRLLVDARDIVAHGLLAEIEPAADVSIGLARG